MTRSGWASHFLLAASLVFCQLPAQAQAQAARGISRKDAVQKQEASLATADALQADGKYEEAIEEYRRYLSSHPDDVTALRKVSVCERYVGLLNAALAHLKQARKLLEKQKRLNETDAQVLQDIKTRIVMSDLRDAGVAAAKEGECDVALVNLRKVNRDEGEKTAASVFWAAKCEEVEGRRFEAYRGYRDLVHRKTGHPLEARAQARMTEVVAALPKIRITALPEAPPDTEVEIDWYDDGDGIPDETVPRSDLPKTLVAPPGRSKLTIRAKGREPRELPIVVSAAETAEVHVAPGLRGPAEWAYQAARTKFEEGDYEDALDLAKAAEQLFPNIETRYLIARATFRTRSENRGIKLVEEVLKDLMGDDPRRQEIEQETERMLIHAPRLLVSLQPEVPSSVVITAGGRELRQGLPTRMDSGWYNLKVEEKLLGLKGETFVDVQQGATRRYSVEFIPRTLSSDARVPFTLIGGATALLGTSSVLGLLAALDAQRLRRLCPVPEQCTPTGASLSRDGGLKASFSTALAIGSLVPAVPAVILLLWRRHTVPPRLEISPIVGSPDAAQVPLGLAVTGAW